MQRQRPIQYDLRFDRTERLCRRKYGSDRNKKRGSRNAKLYCVGRDIENAEINLQFDSDLKKWVVTDEPTAPKSKANIFLAALYVYIKKRKLIFSGTASELIEKLKSVSDETFYPNRVTRDLVRNGYTLRKYGIDFEYKRTRNCRLIILHYDRERDSSDSKNGSGVTVNRLTFESMKKVLQNLAFTRCDGRNQSKFYCQHFKATVKKPNQRTCGDLWAKKSVG